MTFRGELRDDDQCVLRTSQGQDDQQQSEFAKRTIEVSPSYFFKMKPPLFSSSYTTEDP